MTSLKNPCWFPLQTGATREDLFKTIEERLGTCDHAGAVDLMPRDGRFFAVFDECCFDPELLRHRCQKSGSGSLHLYASRVSASTVPLKVHAAIELTPATWLITDGGTEKQGVCHFFLAPFVLHPYYPKAALNSNWEQTLRVIVKPPPKLTPAAVEVRLTVRRETPKPTSQLISLPVTLGIESRSQFKLEGVFAVDANLAMIVMSETVKLLLRDGWEFLKKKSQQMFGLTEEDHFVQLKIGELVLSETESRAESISASEFSGISMPLDTLTRLDGLNRHFENLSVRRRNLYGVLDRGSNVIEKANTQTEIDLIEKEMNGIREEVWVLVKGSGQVDLRRVPKKAAT